MLDVSDGRVIDRAPLQTAVDLDLSEQTIGGALLAAGASSAFFWSFGPAGRVRKISIDVDGTLQVKGNGFVGAGLLRDWVWDPLSDRMLLSVRDDPHLYLIDGDLRLVSVLSLPTPAGSLGLLHGGQALALLDGPAEGLATVDLVGGRAPVIEVPWQDLPGFSQPPATSPILNVAPVALDTHSNVAYIGSLRTDGAHRNSPLLVVDLVHREVRDILVDERLATPSRLALHPSGLELYVSGDVSTSAVDTNRLEVVTDLAPGRLTALSLSESGRAGVGVNIENTMAFLFDGVSGETLTATLQPDGDPTELAGVAVIVSEAIGMAFVVDRFGDAVLVLPF